MSTVPTPDTTLLSTPDLSSPHPTENPIHPGPTPYRASYFHFSSSPYPAGEPLDSPHIRDEDEGMEMDGVGGGYCEGMEDEVKGRYEETNRLLRELEVVRRRRWGEGG